MRRPLLYVSVGLLGLAFWVIGTGCWPFVQWSILNCTHEDIDIASGRIRRQHILVGLCVNESIEESALSSVLLGQAELPAEWRRVNTFSPGVHHSPHYRYHGAISQIRKMEVLWELAQFTPDAKQRMAQDVLVLWRRGQSDSLVRAYLRQAESLMPDRGGPETIAARDLPSLDSKEYNLTGRLQ